jgi:hypothetical protein
VPHEKLNDEFLKKHVPDQQKCDLLIDLSKQKCELIGVVGRKAFHIFDKTNMTWIANIRALGYQELAEIPEPGSDSDY